MVGTFVVCTRAIHIYFLLAHAQTSKRVQRLQNWHASRRGRNHSVVRDADDCRERQVETLGIQLQTRMLHSHLLGKLAC